MLDTHNIIAGEQVTCQNARRSFLNEDGCKLSYLPNACSPGGKPTEVVELTEANLAGINALTGRKLYAVTGLPIEAAVNDAGKSQLGPPCSWSRSRWVRDPSDSACENTASIGEVTQKTFSDLIGGRYIRTDIDYNPNVVEVRRSIRGCDAQDDAKLDLGNIRAGDGTCWKHAHISERIVIDLTSADASKYTKTGSATVTINDMDYFYNVLVADGSPHTLVGTLDDHVELDGSEPSPLDDPAVKEAYTTLDLNPSEGPVLMCGSPNEVASDPFHGDRGFDVVVPENTGYRTFSIWEHAAQKHTTWTKIILEGADQLRQKMAWSLSQIVAVGLPDSGTVFNEETEHWTAFYGESKRRTRLLTSFYQRTSSVVHFAHISHSCVLYQTCL